jgi:hypothetical protein
MQEGASPYQRRSLTVEQATMSDGQRLPDEETNAAATDVPEWDGQPAPLPELAAVQEDGPARQGSEFDPTPYIRQLRGRGGGSDYLDVKWRLLWLRKEHPDAEIVTELVQHDPQLAIFKATVTVPTGGKATGYGSETASDFPDFIEKAETKAIGRALNALGYGAQFGDPARTDDPSPGPARDRRGQPAAPVARPVPLPQRGERQNPRPAAQPEPPSPSSAMADAPSPAASDPELVEYSWSAFWPWARERGLNGPREIENLIGQQVAGLSPAELRDLIVAADAQR